MPKLENWSITKRGDNPYQAPELWKSVLQGNVYGHSRFDLLDGELITTSVVTAINVKEKWAETHSGSHYELGEVDAQWIKWIGENGFTLEDFIKPILHRVVQTAVNEPKH
jgi:hypothetical protein